ncbi:30S ribosomal protein S5 [Candidatus Parcubacteria bacterium]|nr:30S ribosomal protein S5 [Patescibacteria group bacterium]MBU4381135.1 30S ribosomal protein S5 [Patescibacteria group bacterium]MCG2689142.1 30S ribosomal protein S5 [Candidatus Parcubacteria bacterium]
MQKQNERTRKNAYGARTPKDSFEEKIIEIKRVAKKTKGGNKIAFSVLAVVGNKEGSIGISLGKAGDTASAIAKATSGARRKMFTVPVRQGTIPHEVWAKYSACQVFIKPAPDGAGIIAGGAVRKVLEVAGIKNVSSKMLGSNNKLNNVYAVIKALKSLKSQRV